MEKLESDQTWDLKCRSEYEEEVTRLFRSGEHEIIYKHLLQLSRRVDVLERKLADPATEREPEPEGEEELEPLEFRNPIDPLEAHFKGHLTLRRPEAMEYLRRLRRRSPEGREVRALTSFQQTMREYLTPAQMNRAMVRVNKRKLGVEPEPLDSLPADEQPGSPEGAGGGEGLDHLDNEDLSVTVESVADDPRTGLPDGYRDELRETARRLRTERAAGRFRIIASDDGWEAEKANTGDFIDAGPWVEREDGMREATFRVDRPNPDDE